MKDDDEELKNMLASLNLFIEHIDEVIGVFEPTYTAGEFCAGLTFGSAGSNLLYKMAELIISTHMNMVKSGLHVPQHKKIEKEVKPDNERSVGKITNGPPRRV